MRSERRVVGVGWLCPYRSAASDLAVGEVPADAPDVFSRVAGEPGNVGLLPVLNEHGVTDRVGQLAAPLVERSLSAPVGADGGHYGVVGHRPSVTDIHVATQRWLPP